MKETFETDRRACASAFRATLVALLLIVCAAATGARAQSPAEDLPQPSQEQPARPGREVAGPDLVRALNLSPEQRTEIARIRREVALQTRAVNIRVRRARLALEEAVYAPVADDALIEQRAAEVAAAEGARARLRAQTELRIRRLLSPEQLNAFRELRLRALARQQRRLNRRPAQPRRLPLNAGEPPPPAGPTAADPESNPAADPARRQSQQTRRLPAARPRRGQPLPPRP
jgi:Spy/CpxP family protein refolding chaperone